VPTGDAAPLDLLAGLAPANPPPGSFIGGAPTRRDIGRDIAGERHRQRAPGAARDLKAFVTCI
jgi:hypothetical protein